MQQYPSCYSKVIQWVVTMIETLNRTNSQQNQNQTHPHGEIIYKYVY
jgi:hypothetical protein